MNINNNYDKYLRSKTPIITEDRDYLLNELREKNKSSVEKKNLSVAINMWEKPVIKE